MARSLSQTLTLTLSRLSPLLCPSSRLFNHRRCSYFTDPPPPAADPETPSETEIPAGLRLLEDVIYNIIIRRSQPDWLPFVPGASYWVPPRKQQVGVVRIMQRITEPLSAEEEQSLTTVRGWPSSSYYGKDAQKVSKQSDDEES